MRIWLVIGFVVAAARAFADVSVVASVDRNRIGFGESVTMTIEVQGAQNAEPPSIPPIDGLQTQYAGHKWNIVMGDSSSQSSSFTYQVTPGRVGGFTIPSVEVNVGGKNYRTEPIKLVVEKAATQSDLSQTLFGRVLFPVKQVYLGQAMPLQVLVYSRADVPLRGLVGFNYEADGLGFKFLPKVKSGTKIVT